MSEENLSINSPVPTAPKPRKNKTWPIWVFVPIIALGTGLGGGMLGAVIMTNDDITTTNTVTQTIESEGDAIAATAEAVGPSVVSIVTEQTTTSRNSFYGGQNYTTEAAGTGVIVSADGYVITNKHVIPDNTTNVTVVLQDGTEYDGVSVVDRDPINDIAFLKISNVNNLSAATIGDSEDLKIGTKVIAVGNALGQFQNTVTAGIISGLDRSITASTNDSSATETLTGLLQTDAAINSGNSGGPLINYNGEVVGLNTAVASDANNIGFAIPSSAFTSSIASVLQNGKINKAYLGVYYTTITKSIAAEENLPTENGALIGNDNQSPTVAGSPAEQAGLRADDIIVAINGVALDTHNTLSAIIGQHLAGDEVELTILRSGDEMSIKVTLGEYPQ